MISIYDLKPKFQRLLRPITNLLAKYGITANMVTIFAMLCSFAMGATIYLYPNNIKLMYGIPMVLFFRMALNAIDGMLAREHNMQSSLGAILNEIGDVLSDIALYLPFALVTGFNPQLIVIIVLLAVITEFVGIMGQIVGGSRRYDGPCGKSDRAFIFGLLALLLALEVPVTPYLFYLEWVIFALLSLTILNRIHKALTEIK